MARASGSRVQISYVAEITPGVTPTTPSMKILRVLSRNINSMKNTLRSEEVRADRQVPDVRHGFNQVDGSLGFELSRAAYDDMLEAAMSGTWTAVSSSGSPDLGAQTTPSHMFLRTAGSFITDGYLPGDIIVTTGFTNAANNGKFKVTSVNALSILVEGTPLVTETSTSGRTMALAGKRLKIGSVLRTFTFERGFLDVNQYQVFRGVAVNSMTLGVKPESIVNGTFGVLGMAFDALTGTPLDASPDAAPTNSPFTSFEGSLYEGGTLIAVVTGVDISLANGRSVQPVVGSKFSPDVFEGTANITGTLTAFFEDATMLNKFINETESSLWLRLNDINGTDFMVIRIPRLKYTGGTMDPPQEGPVPLTMPFQALVDSTSGSSFTIQRSNS